MVNLSRIDQGHRRLYRIREYDHEKDRRKVEEVEKICEVGTSGKITIYTHLLGDPLCRVRNSPPFIMMVSELAEDGDEDEDEKEKEIVGMVRGCVKTVTCGKRLSRVGRHVPVYTKVGYILGLRVSPHHRRKGIASRLVAAVETWMGHFGADYSYVAMENDNHASVDLFKRRCGYQQFRTPSILVNPVRAHDITPTSRTHVVLRLSVSEASALYLGRFSTTEFFPRDIIKVLSNPHSLGTVLALPRGYVPAPAHAQLWDGIETFLTEPPESWAVLSVWNCKEVFRLEVKGASRVLRAIARAGMVIDRAFPFLGVPSFPEIFRPFGAHFAYGVGGEGPRAVEMVQTLFGHAHNLARSHGCAVVVTEVSIDDPVRSGIPHWKSLSCPEDLWCIKRLGDDYSDGAVGDWTKSPPGASIFVDPREV